MKETLSEKTARANGIIDEILESLKQITHTFFTPQQVEENDSSMFEGIKVTTLNKHGHFTQYVIAKIDQGSVYLVGLGDDARESEYTDFSSLNTDNLLELASYFD